MMSTVQTVFIWTKSACLENSDYDGASTVEDFKFLVKELVYQSQKARDCLWEGRLFGSHGGPVRKDEEEAE